MAVNKTIYIPPVDIIKSGISRKDPMSEMKDDDGFIHITRTKSGKESKNRAFVKEYEEQKEKLDRLKSLADEYGLSKKDIKETKEDIEEDDRKAEEKAAKRASKYMDPYFSALISGGVMPADVAEYIENGGKKKKKKKKKHKNQLEGLSIKEKKKDKKKDSDSGDINDESEKKKRSKSEVAETFKAVEKISKQNLEQIDETLDIINTRMNEIINEGERMKSKDYVLSNYINAKSSLISTRQRIATDIGSNRKTIYDIEFKKDKNSSDAASNENAMLLRMFPGIALGGKTQEFEKYIAGDGKNKDAKKKKKKHWEDYDDDLEDDELDRRERELLDSGEIEYSKYDQSIAYEGNFETAVKYAYKTGDYEFIALDSDGNIIDVPKSMLPSKKSARMKFDEENDSCIDVNTNRMYNMISVPRL